MFVLYNSSNIFGSQKNEDILEIHYGPREIGQCNDATCKELADQLDLEDSSIVVDFREVTRIGVASFD